MKGLRGITQQTLGWGGRGVAMSLTVQRTQPGPPNIDQPITGQVMFTTKESGFGTCSLLTEQKQEQGTDRIYSVECNHDNPVSGNHYM